MPTKGMSLLTCIVFEVTLQSVEWNAKPITYLLTYSLSGVRYIMSVVKTNPVLFRPSHSMIIIQSPN